MKRNYFFAAVAALFLCFSCQNDETLIEEFSTNSEKNSTLDIATFDFKGLQVVDRFGWLETRNSKNTKSETVPDYILFQDPERIGNVVELILPDFPFAKRPEDALAMIQSDFPTLELPEIAQNMDIIEEYYDTTLDIAYEERYVQEYKTGPFQEIIPERNDDYYRADCIIDEAGYDSPRVRKLKAQYALYKANRATRIAEDNFPGAGMEASDTKRDAMRHVVWTAMLANSYITLTSRQKRVDFARAASDANEVCTVNEEPGREMDLHNNEIGIIDIFSARSAVNHILGIPVGLTLPSTNLIAQDALFELSVAKFIDEANMTPSAAVAEIHATPATQVVYLKIPSTSSGGTCPPGKTYYPVTDECCDLIMIGTQTYWTNCVPRN